MNSMIIYRSFSPNQGHPKKHLTYPKKTSLSPFFFCSISGLRQILAAEANAWERKSELCRSSGDKTGELDAMQRRFETERGGHGTAGT